MHGGTMPGMEATPNATSKIRRPVRIGQLAKQLGVDPSTLWRWERAGHMPRRHRLVPGSPGIWWDDEIAAWQNRAPAATNHEAA
jgi:predicted DNA-binding transcriptional regulator AlpA